MELQKLISKLDDLLGDFRFRGNTTYNTPTTLQDALQSLYLSNNTHKTIACLLNVILNTKKNVIVLSKRDLQRFIDGDSHITSKFKLTSDGGFIYKAVISILTESEILEFVIPMNRKKAMAVIVLDSYLLSQVEHYSDEVIIKILSLLDIKFFSDLDIKNFSVLEIKGSRVIGFKCFSVLGINSMVTARSQHDDSTKVLSRDLGVNNFRDSWNKRKVSGNE